MHIVPGVVDGAKVALSSATAAASFGLAAKALAPHGRHALLCRRLRHAAA